jgi:hypothetical protein
MKNIEKRHIVRKAEIANELWMTYQLSLLLEKNSIPLINNPQSYWDEYDSYISQLPAQYHTAKNYKRLQSEIDELKPLSISSAQSVYNSLRERYSEALSFNLKNYNKEGLKEGVGQKSDLHIIITTRESVINEHFSLKQYMGFRDPQVASGTYLSTLCGLGFTVAGRGVFLDDDGDKFLSKKSHVDTICQKFSDKYGEEAEVYIKNLVKITEDTHQLRTRQTKPPPQELAKFRKNIGSRAVVEFLSLLNLMNSNSSGELRDRFIERSGLVAKSGKQIIYSAFNGKNTVSFNTLSDKMFSELISELNESDVKLEVIQSGTKQDGQGITFRFVKDEKAILSADMPLTINTNGAWANEDRMCSLSKQFVKKGHIRPQKAKQLDTSTNVYVKLKKGCFNKILKERKKEE